MNGDKPPRIGELHDHVTDISTDISDGDGTQSEDVHADPIHEPRTHDRELQLRITELRRAHAEVEKSRAAYVNLYDSSPVGYLTIDRDGRIEQANLTIAAMLGVKRQELINLPLSTMMTSAEGDRFLLHLERVFTNHVKDVCWLEITGRSEGQLTLAFESIAHVSADSGSPPTCQTVVIDVSAHAQARYELHKRNRALVHLASTVAETRLEREHLADVLEDRDARMRAILNTLRDAVITVDGHGIIDSVNPAAMELFGYHSREIVGRNIQMLVPPTEGKGCNQFLRQDLSPASMGRARKLIARRKDGRTFPIELTVGQFIDHGVRFTGVARDITEQEDMAAEIRQSHKMEAVGRLASGVAHDFNNLLMGISGCSQLARGCLDPGHPATPYIDEILQAAASGAAITRQLLAFSRKRATAPETLELNAQIRENQTMLKRLLGEDIQLSLDIGNGALWVHADRVNIQQVLMNLVANARDAIQHGGRLSIATSSRCILHGEKSRLEHGNYALLSVIDSGCGIDEHSLAHMFEPFYTTKQQGEGTGLGLATVYAIVIGAGGHIEATSELGSGTAFTLWFPLVTPPLGRRASKTATGDPESIAPATCLVIEDDPLVRLTIRRYFESWGHQVLTATNGKDAREQFQRYQGVIDLVLTDVILPGLSGPEIAAELKATQPDIPVLYMSAHSRRHLLSRGRIGPTDRSLQKPFGQDELRKQVQQALAGQQHLTGTLLIVDDSDFTKTALSELLGDMGHEILTACSIADALRKCQRLGSVVDVVLVDVSLPDGTGMDLAAALRALFPGLAVMYITSLVAGDVSLQTALREPRTIALERPVSFPFTEARVQEFLAGRK